MNFIVSQRLQQNFYVEYYFYQTHLEVARNQLHRFKIKSYDALLHCIENGNAKTGASLNIDGVSTDYG